jgi:class 3 adenylate cyclase/TolB-like protein
MPFLRWNVRMGELGSADILEFGHFRLDRRGRCLYRRNQTGKLILLPVGRTALDLLDLLIERPGEVVEREEIRKVVWRGKTVEDANLATQIFNLREHIGRNRIKTISGRGYRFVGPVRRLNGNAGAVLPTRRLAAILAADVVGYSRLMGADEEGTLERLKALRRQLIYQKIEEHQGRIVKTTGDGLLVEFASVVNAVRCAAEVQRGMMDREPGLLDEERIKLRIGINLGDVIADDDDIFGDGVNVAARLEALADPGGICVSGVVHDQIRDKLPYSLADWGEQSVKNIARPVRVYAMRPEAIAELPPSRSPPAISIPKPAVAPRLSIVVLPFADLSEGATRQYFVDGIVDSLTTDLSRIEGMLVISRNTAFTYRNNPVATKQIGRELSVRYVLEGSVQWAGTRIRVNAQLIDAENDAHLWAQWFDRDIGDLLALQDEITSRIAVALHLELVNAEAARRSENLDALDYIFRGRALAWGKPPSAADFGDAIGLFERALTLDPTSVGAQSWLAIVLANRLLDFPAHAADGDLERADELASNAVAALARSSVAHFAKGQVLRVQKRYEEAIAEYETVLTFNRNWAGAIFALAWCKFHTGLIEETIPLFEQLLRLSPRDPYIGIWYARIGIAHLLQSRMDEAIAWLEKSRTALPSRPWTRSSLAVAYAHKGETALAAAEIAEAQRVSPDGRYTSIARLKEVGYLGVPKVRALFETIYLTGYRKAGVPDV